MVVRKCVCISTHASLSEMKGLLGYKSRLQTFWIPSQINCSLGPRATLKEGCTVCCKFSEAWLEFEQLEVHTQEILAGGQP